MGTTRRYRKTDKSKTAKPKKKLSKRAALIKKVEKEGKVKLRTDWSALYRKPTKKKPAKKKPSSTPRPAIGRPPREGREERLQSIQRPSRRKEKKDELALRRKWIKKQREEMRRDKRAKRKV